MSGREPCTATGVRCNDGGSRRSTLALGLAVLAFALVAFASAPPAAAATDRLPDLEMAPLDEFRTTTTYSGQRRLRFTSVIVNTGDGAFRLRGTRSSTRVSTFTTKQRIYNDSGGYRDVSTPAIMKWSGDGHYHNHVMGLQTTALFEILPDGELEKAAGSKQGFCFYDNVEWDLSLPRAPSSPYYRGCGSRYSLSVTMGQSVGWGDEYPWDIAYQYVVITGLPSGKYRLYVTADKQGWFAEKDDTNNGTWTDLELTSSGVKVLAQGPSA
jgi:hypothetical protein